MQSFANIDADGYVGADPVSRGSQDKLFVTFSLAVNRKWKKDNEIVEETNWYRVNVPPYLVKLVQDYVRKGDPVRVIGEPRVQKWRKGDESFSGICIYASRIKLLGSKSENEASLSEPADESSSLDMTEATEGEVDVDSPPFPDDESNIT